ncbi:uncharacterized protein Z520_09276 [Fonsecaea multimorphosa CBS 102226]|uniref:Uncharacterized protein n=1 Tax=Fonsecaea multimorphosa CBS 102226 TaxID=1442371 RepID=A0A0D2ICY9_9EURO|nr:uncharacterized protein Z520_09276 [Fonsecaea multimorphosa CBS 102226]KIX94966.1 hypothetical protein Z520_09276 [Fonsecaea multimorphosa CBS 102226]OAL20617.1 hypothetical protein AYO22_08626 [Fonsecaea multimorphosa]
MPTILTPQGWVKVAPPPPRKRAVNHDPAAALRGPLAYLACQRSPPKINVGGGGNVKGRADYPYDLSASPEKLRRQGEANAHAKAERSFSAPIMHGGLHPSDHDDDMHEFLGPEMRSPPPPSPKSKAKSRSSPKSRTSSRQHHDNDDRHSHVSASSSSSSSSRSSAASSRSSASSVSSAPSTKSYHRPAPPAGVQARRPPSMPSAEPRAPYYSMPRYDHYGTMPPPMHPASMSQPMSRGNARSLSYSWYNATTPLSL